MTNLLTLVDRSNRHELEQSHNNSSHLASLHDRTLFFVAALHESLAMKDEYMKNFHCIDNP